MPDALSTDPDDDHVRPAGRAATDAGNRHRIGIAPATRLRDGRRPRGVAGADIVHHAGDLHLHGSPVTRRCTAPRPTEGVRAGASRVTGDAAPVLATVTGGRGGDALA